MSQHIPALTHFGLCAILLRVTRARHSGRLVSGDNRHVFCYAGVMLPTMSGTTDTLEGAAYDTSLAPPVVAPHFQLPYR